MNIWITGASSGLGLELAQQYAAAGHEVCVSARNQQALDDLAASSKHIHPFPLDVTNPGEIATCFAAICAAHSTPDLCILNAGTHFETPVSSFSAADYTKIMDINFMGVVNCLESIVPAYLQAGKGSIAVVSSVAGYRGLPKASAYGASKAALINMCEAMQPELASAGVKLQLVNPGFVRTPLTDQNKFDMPFLMEVEDAAASMIRGLESQRFEVTFPKRFTWQLKFLRMLPYTLYLRLTRKLIK